MKLGPLNHLAAVDIDRQKRTVVQYHNSLGKVSLRAPATAQIHQL